MVRMSQQGHVKTLLRLQSFYLGTKSFKAQVKTSPLMDALIFHTLKSFGRTQDPMSQQASFERLCQENMSTKAPNTHISVQSNDANRT